MIKTRQTAYTLYDKYRLKVSTKQEQLQIDFLNNRGEILASQDIPYDPKACTPTIDRITLVLDTFLTDFANCGNEEDAERELPVSRLSIASKLEEETRTQPTKISSPIQLSNERFPSISSGASLRESSKEDDVEEIVTHKLSLGIFGTGESHIDHLALHFGGKVKLKYSGPWINLIGSLGVMSPIHANEPGSRGGNQEELRAQPMYALLGTGKCFYGESQELCLLGLAGREFFRSEGTTEDKGSGRKQILSQWLFEGGIEYGFKILARFNAHIGTNIGFRPGELKISNQDETSQVQLNGWTWSAYTGFSYSFWSL
jgi:hypothetical protein